MGDLVKAVEQAAADGRTISASVAAAAIREARREAVSEIRKEIEDAILSLINEGCA